MWIISCEVCKWRNSHRRRAEAHDIARDHNAKKHMSIPRSTITFVPDTPQGNQDPCDDYEETS